jgi:hypothetical protein
VQPRVQRATGHCAEKSDDELRDDEKRELGGAVGEQRYEREADDEDACDRHRNDRYGLATLYALDERNGGQLKRLRDERQRRQHADHERIGTQRKGEADEDDAAVQRAGEAGPRSVAHERALADGEGGARDGRVRMQVHGAEAARETT